jgi:mRNA interferase RelE/StbE
MYKLIFSPQANKERKKLPLGIQLAIVRKLRYFLSSDNPLVFASRLKDHELGNYRFRVGDYRVIFDVENETITVLTVGHRKDIYR